MNVGNKSLIHQKRAICSAYLICDMLVLGKYSTQKRLTHISALSPDYIAPDVKKHPLYETANVTPC